MLRRYLAARRRRQLHELANALLGDALVYIQARDAVAAHHTLRQAMQCANRTENGLKAMAIVRAMHACKRAISKGAHYATN